MPDRDDKKRASLRGRGWEIMRGQSGPSGSNNDDSIEPTPEETSELFAIGGSIGLDEPQDVSFADSNIPPLPHDFADYELDLLPLDEDIADPIAATPASDASTSWDWIETNYENPPHERETTEIPASLHTEDIGSTDSLFTSLGVVEESSADDRNVVVEEGAYRPDMQIQQASDDAAFEALMEASPAAPPLAVQFIAEPDLAIGDSNIFEGTMNLGELDENLAALSRDLESTLETGPSAATSIPARKPNVAVIEALPPVESKTPNPVVLHGQMKFVEAESLIPTEPEAVDTVVDAPDNGPRSSSSSPVAPEGVGLGTSQRRAIARDEVYLESPPLDFPEDVPTLPEELRKQDQSGGAALDLADFITFDDDDEDLIDSPFDDEVRVPSNELFPPPQDADPSLVDQFVDDDSLQALFDGIENLQAEVASKSWLTRKRADTYQRELLEASSLLLESRENYDDARAIGYRIRGDLMRDERARNEIEEFAPGLRRMILLWFVVILIAGLLTGIAESALQDADADFLAAAYVPILFGIAGGLFLAYTTLNRHTAVLRDFDRTHIGWYRFTPIIGALMGFLVYTLWVATIVMSTSQTVTNLDELQYPAVVWVLAFLGGLQQNWVINRLRTLRDGNRTSASAG